MAKKTTEEYFPVTVLKDRVTDLNDGIRQMTNFLRRKKYERFGMTRKLARTRRKTMQVNRDLLKSAIKKLSKT